MELQLGLSLSSSSSSSCDQLSTENFKAGSDLLNNKNTRNGVKDLFGSIPMGHLRKRKISCDDEDHGSAGFHVPQTLPLLVWNNLNCNNNKNQFHEDDDDDDDDEVQSNSILLHHNKNDGEENGVVGWPPVKSCRKKLCHQKNGGDGGGGRSKSMFVKVQMEGVGIARKVDLNLHTSYQTLVRTLANMFGKYYEDVKLTYQDKEGDWLLAGDVPWGSFVDTVQRMRLLRNEC